MIALGIEQAGIADVLARADRLADNVQRDVQAVVDRYAALIAREAKGFAPVDEGDLRSTIRPLIERFAAQVIAGGIPGDSGALVDYADVVELGQLSNPNYPAQPYLGPAFETHRAAFVRDLREAAAP